MKLGSREGSCSQGGLSKITTKLLGFVLGRFSFWILVIFENSGSLHLQMTLHVCWCMQGNSFTPTVKSIFGSCYPASLTRLDFFQKNQELSKQSPRHHIKDWEQQWAEESPFLCLSAQMLVAWTAKDAAIYSGQKLKGAKETQGRGFSLICTA